MNVQKKTIFIIKINCNVSSFVSNFYSIGSVCYNTLLNINGKDIKTCTLYYNVDLFTQNNLLVVIFFLFSENVFKKTPLCFSRDI
jgi:hypothetical protein